MLGIESSREASINVTYRVRIINWRILGQNSWPDRVAISRNIARHGSDSDFWFTRKMLVFLILRWILSLLNCMSNIPIIIYTKSQIENNNPVVSDYCMNKRRLFECGVLKISMFEARIDEKCFNLPILLRGVVELGYFTFEFIIALRGELVILHSLPWTHTWRWKNQKYFQIYQSVLYPRRERDINYKWCNGKECLTPFIACYNVILFILRNQLCRPILYCNKNRRLN